MQNIKGSIEHLRSHQTFPASKADLVATCNGLADFSQEDKQEFANALPDRMYNSANEVIDALGWPKE